MAKKIIVTGGAGFIGHHLCKRLKEQGHWVRGVDWKEPEHDRLSVRHWGICLQE